MTVQILNECRAAFHPIPIVVVHDTLHRLDFSMVDMSADHPIVTLSAAGQR